MNRLKVFATSTYLLVVLLVLNSLYLPYSASVIAAEPSNDEITGASGVRNIYYVDSEAADGGDGSAERPFKTLEQVNSLQLQAGDQLLLKRGSVFKGTLYPKGSGSAEAPILISAYGEGALPLIDAGGSQFMSVDGQRDRKGPFVDTTNPVYGSAVYLYNQEYITVENLHLTNPGQNRNFADADRSGIRVEAYDYGVVRGITIRNNFIENVQGYNGQNDIWTSQAVDAEGRKIPDTTPFYGARTTHRTGGINLITYTAREPEQTNGHGVKYQSLDLGKKITVFDGVLIENNEIVNVQANGITLTNVKGELDNESYRHRHVVIRNNKIVNVSRSGIIPLYTSGVIVEGNYIDTFQSASAGYGCGVWNDRADNMKFINNIVRNGVNTNDGMAFNLDDMTRDGLIANNLIINNVGGGVMLHVRDNSYNRNHRIEGNLFINNGGNNFSNNHVAQIVAVGENKRTKIQNALVINNTFIQEGDARMVSHGDELILKRNIFYSKNPNLATRDVNNHFNVGPNSVFIDNIFYGSAIPTKGATSLFSGNKQADPLLNFAGSSLNPSFYNQILHTGSPALRSDVSFADSGLVYEKDIFGNSFNGNIGAYYGAGRSLTETREAFGVADDRVTKIGTPEIEDEPKASLSSKIYKFTKQNEGVSFTFSGEIVYIYMKKGPGAGKADVYLDNNKVGEIDLYNAGKPEFKAMVYSLKNIPDGEHTLKILNNGQKNNKSTGTAVNFDYFEIHRNLKETNLMAKDLTAIGEPVIETDPAAYGGRIYKFTQADTGMTTTFTGSGYALFMKKGPGAGKAKIFLDDVLVKEVDLYNAKLAAYNVKVFEQLNLPVKEYRLKVLVSAERNVQSTNSAVNFDHLVIYGESLPEKRVYLSDMLYRSDDLDTLRIPLTYHTIGMSKSEVTSVAYTVNSETARIVDEHLQVDAYGSYEVTVNVEANGASYNATAVITVETAEVLLSEQVLHKEFIRHSDTRIHKSSEPDAIDEEPASLSKSVARFSTPETEVALLFYGTGIELFTRNGPKGGIIEVDLDGEKQEINTHAQTKKLAVSVYRNLRLSKGNHLIKIKLKGGQNDRVFNLDGFTVYGFNVQAVQADAAYTVSGAGAAQNLPVLLFDNTEPYTVALHSLPSLTESEEQELTVDEQAQAAYLAVREHVKARYENIVYAASYDIKLLDADNSSVQPKNGGLSVQIPVSVAGLSEEKLIVLSKHGEEDVEVLPTSAYRLFRFDENNGILELNLKKLSNVSVLLADTRDEASPAVTEATATTASEAVTTPTTVTEPTTTAITIEETTTTDTSEPTTESTTVEATASEAATTLTTVTEPTATPTATVEVTTPSPTTTVKPTTTPSPTTTVKPTTPSSPTTTVQATTTPAPTTTVKPTTTPAPTTTVKPTTTPAPTTTVKPTTTPELTGETTESTTTPTATETTNVTTATPATVTSKMTTIATTPANPVSSTAQTYKEKASAPSELGEDKVAQRNYIVIKDGKVSSYRQIVSKTGESRARFMLISVAAIVAVVIIRKRLQDMRLE